MTQKEKAKVGLSQEARFLKRQLLELKAQNAEQKKMADALLSNFKSILAVYPEGICIVDKKQDIIYLNPALEHEFGQPQGRKCFKYFYNRQEPCPWCQNDAVFSGKMVRWERMFSKKNRVYDLIDIPLLNENGTIYKLEIFHDITEHKESEESLKESHERLKSVLDSLDSLVYVADFHSHEILFINKYGRDIWGDVHGQKCWQAIQKSPKGPCSFCTNDKLVSDTGVLTGVYRWELKNTVNGRLYECRDQAIRWPGRGLVRMEIATDITERKQLEEERIAAVAVRAAAEVDKKRIVEIEKAYKELQATKDLLVQSEKLASIGELSAGIAHELNNPLTGILGLARYYLEHKTPGEQEHGDLTQIVQACEHMEQVVSGLLDFAKPSLVEIAELDCNVVVESALGFCKILIGQNVQLEKNYGQGLPKAMGNRNRIEQVIINIIDNAMEAMEMKGMFKIATRVIMVNGVSFVEMEFEDSGYGIDKDSLKRLFEPFYTTKRPDKGVGLGLSISYAIIKEHSGTILVESPPTGKEKGASFKVRIPAILGT